MSIQSEISRISGNVSAALTAITQKGGTVPAGSNSDNLATLISQIPTGGGGGGVSNVVTGTFNGTTTGAAMDVNLAYSGSGFPMAIIIFPSEGYLNPNGTFGKLIQRYATSVFATVKTDTTTPSYTGQTAFHVNRYKNSTSNATTMNNNVGNDTAVFNNIAATSTASAIVKIRSATKMSVFIASSSYGFVANIEYRYVVFYSS